MIAQSVADILGQHVKLSVEGIDRMYLNVYVPRLQTEQGVGVGRCTFSSLMLDEDFEGGEKRVADASESEQGQHHGYFGELRLRSEADSVGARRGCFVVLMLSLLAFGGVCNPLPARS